MPNEKPTARIELETLLSALVPILDATDLADPDAERQLEAVWPHQGETWNRARALCEQGVDEGWLVPREAGSQVKFGRLVKDLDGYTVDCVLMEGKAKGHTHPRGEATLAFAWEGDDPRFDGKPAGWVVYPPGSRHVPTVTGGKMLFVYFLPGGEMTWDED